MRRRRRLLAIVVMISLVLSHFMQTREVKADDIIGSNEDWEYELNKEQKKLEGLEQCIVISTFHKLSKL